MLTTYRNARLVDATGERYGDLCVEDGMVVCCGPLSWRRADSTVDVKGLILMPAFIDLHCHLRDPGFPEKETMETGMRAALAGGYAHLCAMANTNPVIETPALVETNLNKAEGLRLCRLTQAAAAGELLGDSAPTDRAALSRVTNLISNDGNTILSDDFMRQLLIDSTKYGFVISTHCQPERATVARDLTLLREVGGNLHIGHISRAETVDMIRRAKSEGLAFTCEVTPHHLIGFDSDYKVNPPLRSKQDVLALIEGLRDGTIDCLASDHAPHTPADKANGAAGISNIKYAMQVCLKVFIENGIPLSRLAEMSSLAPAKRLGRKAGLLQPGYPADITILSVAEESVVERDGMISRSQNTPFDGWRVRGRIHTKIVEGEARYEYGKIS